MMNAVSLCFQAPEACSVRLYADGECCLTAMLPKATQEQKLLFRLAKPVRADAALTWEGDAVISSWKLHPAEAVMTGVNPITMTDLPDMDVIRVDDTYYMISTTMYFMPGGVILRSYDLIHWEYLTRIYDVLDDTPRQRLDEGNAYGAGMWAATLRHHKGMFYVMFVANDTHKTYLYRSESIMGPWRRNIVEGFYHDCSLLFDDDDRAYLAYGGTQIHLLELNGELTGPKAGGVNRIIADSGESNHLGYEGSHLYKIGGKYYLFVIHSAKERWHRVESCLMSDSLTGEFTGGVVLNDEMGLRADGVAQGAIVDTPDGRWYALMFQDTGAMGRTPMLMPMTWEDDFPVLGVDGKVPLEVCNISTRPDHVYRPLVDSDDFTADSLKDVWEWNHIPRLHLVSMGGGSLRIRTEKATDCITQTPNLLTQRAVLPACFAEVTLDASALNVGDVAGICVLQHTWEMIGLAKEADGFSLVLRTRGREDGANGEERARIPWNGSSIRLRAEMHFSAQRDFSTLFYWDGEAWRQLGSEYPMWFLLEHFVGHRFALFVQSTQTAGGEAAFSHFVYGQMKK